MLEQNTLLQERYRIIKTVGGGGMGQVYLAHDTRLADKTCALKEFVPDPHATPGDQEQAAVQFHREAAILAHLSYPNMPNVSDYFEQDDNFYLIMDYIEGETLLDMLTRSPGGLPEQDVITWALQLCKVLDYLHGQDSPVIFRDMKPANVMLTAEGQIKLIDFGVVRLFDPTKRTDTLKMGTAGYAPPEQYAGQGQTTQRSDIYSLGATLHELLTGADPTAHPFVFTPPRQLKHSISPRLSNVVMRALSLDPYDRFPSAQAMSQALHKATRPGGLKLPIIQRQRGTGTAAMSTATVAPARRNRAAGFALGVLRWLGRVALTLTVTLIIVMLILLLVGSFALSAVAENAIAGAEWGLTENTATHFTTTENELQKGVQVSLEPYALNAAGDVQIDLRSPDTVELSLLLRSHPLRLEARLAERGGVPAITLERLNGVTLYVVGGIISNGINRGFKEAWQDTPLQIESLTIGEEQLTVVLEGKTGRLPPTLTSTPTPAYATVHITNKLEQRVTVNIGSLVHHANVFAHSSRVILLPPGTYTYTIMLGDAVGAQGEMTWGPGEQDWTIR
ncbi:MAG: serine/threonine-protein kinase [Chloroflexota bacterium]|nr:serine/threonine-protein kinase [Chloroflexota bacterium]